MGIFDHRVGSWVLKASFVALGAASAGCSSSQDESGQACINPIESETAAARAPSVKPQGLSVQGISPQGMSVQGINVQGINVQGFTLQGFSAQGFQSNGLWSNGILQDGIWNADVRQELRLQANELEAVTAEGKLLTGADTVGLELALHNDEHLTIESYAKDEGSSDVALYTLTYKGQNICGEGVSGMFVPGLRNLETGARLKAAEIPSGVAPFTYSCTTGFLAKCVRWGYKPWLGDEAADLHQACTRMAPADYCGNAVPHTQNGTRIDIVDVDGIQKRESKPGEMTFEAAWGPDGAVCVNQTRYADSVVGQGPILPSCWQDLPHCETPEEGAALGGRLANFSVKSERTFCEAPVRY